MCCNCSKRHRTTKCIVSDIPPHVYPVSFVNVEPKPGPPKTQQNKPNQPEPARTSPPVKAGEHSPPFASVEAMMDMAFEVDRSEQI